MADIVDKATRSRMMAGIKSKNTKPEIIIRKALFAKGFRYRLHVKSLPGKPDIVFTKRRAVIFVNGCFWHGHDCHLFKKPASNIDFWTVKIDRNKNIDAKTVASLLNDNWRVLTIWECSLKGKERLPLEKLIYIVTEWLNSEISLYEVSGNKYLSDSEGHF